MASTLGFTLGNHTFVPAGIAAPLSRMRGPRKRICGGAPPSYLRDLLVEATIPGPADAMADGRFCGHGEPTFALFDVLLKGCREVEFGLHDQGGPKYGVCVRPVGGTEADWRLIANDTLSVDSLAHASTTPTKPVARCQHPDTDEWLVRVALGLEYPPDCSSENEVTWLTVAVCSSGQPLPIVVYERELA